jgi:hypothetical protein
LATNKTATKHFLRLSARQLTDSENFTNGIGVGHTENNNCAFIEDTLRFWHNVPSAARCRLLKSVPLKGGYPFQLYDFYVATVRALCVYVCVKCDIYHAGQFFSAIPVRQQSSNSGSDRVCGIIANEDVHIVW